MKKPKRQPEPTDAELETHLTELIGLLREQYFAVRYRDTRKAAELWQDAKAFIAARREVRMRMFLAPKSVS